MELGKKICPYCGETLSLIPPNSELLPSRTGFSSNGVTYYFPPKRRIISYTSNPKSNYSHYKSNGWHFEGTLNPNIVKNDRIHPDWHVVPVKYAQNRINKGGIHLFSHELIFFCSNCKKKLALNYDPVSLWSLIREILTSLFLVFLFIATILAVNNDWISFNILLSGIFVFILLFLATVLYTIISLICIKRYRSNFVLTDELDALIHQEINFVISPNNLRSLNLKESNVFSAEIDGQQFQIYLEKKEKSKLYMHICGINGEQNDFTALLRKKMSGRKKVTLPLSFEGKPIGNAELIEVSAPRTN